MERRQGGIRSEQKAPAPVEYNSAALKDLREIHAWYEKERIGLGDDFESAFAHTLGNLALFPSTNVPVHGTIRKTRVKRYPYHIYYRYRFGKIRIVAVLHCARSPAYCRRRTQ